MDNVTGKPNNVSVPNFDFNTSSLMSLTTGVKYEDPRYHLNLVQKKELPSERPYIHSTKFQRLAFYRAFASTPAKTEIVATQLSGLNSFLWFYAFNVFFKSLPHGFVHFFLAAYAPEEHMFVAKMVPFCHGIKYLFILVGFLELLLCVDLQVMLFHYAAFGIIAKNPWNRCLSRTYFDRKFNFTIHCYEIEEFSTMFINKTHSKDSNFYIHQDTGEHFQVAQLEYYRIQEDRINESWDISVFLIIWAFVQILQTRVWSSYFWKVLNFSQWGINFVDLCTFGYLLFVHYETKGVTLMEQNRKRAVKRSEDRIESSSLWASDLEMLAESITAPPVVHILTSRSTQEIDPSTDSAVMVISNALIFIFRGLLSVRVKVHCEEIIKTELPPITFNEHSWFYLWPIFWQEFYLGDIFSVLYTAASMVCESLIIVVANLCVTESVVYEWPKVKRWMVTATSTCVGIIVYCFTTIDTRAILWVYGKGIATWSEIVFLYLWYPVGRLVDDFTFHYGIPPTQLRILSIRLVPVYYVFKIYIMFSSLWRVLSIESVGEVNSHYVWSWSIMVLPIIVGMLFIIYKYLVIHRATWNYILRPIPKWGPRDFSVRQLRKQFDSRFYIHSEVPRLLSRYLLSKRETKVYKVDVRYDVQRRSTVSKAVGFGAFIEKQKDKMS